MSDERTAVEILTEARSRISDPQRWHRGGYAFGRVKEVKPCDKQARKWCALGSLWKTVGRNPKHQDHIGAVGRFMNDAAWALYGRPVDRVNDTKGHAAVLRVYDEAIRAATKTGGNDGE